MLSKPSESYWLHERLKSSLNSVGASSSNIEPISGTRNIHELVVGDFVALSVLVRLDMQLRLALQGTYPHAGASVVWRSNQAAKK